eukprot:3688278-Rhodomonas_salina.2
MEDSLWLSINSRSVAPGYLAYGPCGVRTGLSAAKSGILRCKLPGEGGRCAGWEEGGPTTVSPRVEEVNEVGG